MLWPPAASSAAFQPSATICRFPFERNSATWNRPIPVRIPSGSNLETKFPNVFSQQNLQSVCSTEADLTESAKPDLKPFLCHNNKNLRRRLKTGFSFQDPKGGRTRGRGLNLTTEHLPKNALCSKNRASRSLIADPLLITQFPLSRLTPLQPSRPTPLPLLLTKPPRLTERQ